MRYVFLVLCFPVSTVFSQVASSDSELVRSSPHGDVVITCDVCHNLDSWAVVMDSVRFDHVKTAFPLVGRHRNITCRNCHSTLRFAEQNPVCVTCHLDKHRGQFGVSCERCHTPFQWNDYDIMRLRHNETVFPLVGAHRTLDCSICHYQGNRTTLPTDCYGCHLNDYNQTSNPNHRSIGFPTSCLDCHSTENWRGTINHDPWFPIYSGKHRSKWNACSDCHTIPGSFPAFSCTSCHSNSDMDREHYGRPGYSNNSDACLRCHPQGKADG